MKKIHKKTIWIIVGIFILLVCAYAIYRDQTRCYEIQSRCTPYDLTTVENSEDIDFYRGLNEKCLGKCGTAKLKLNLEKLWCKYQFKQHQNRTKDRRFIMPDNYNPCPELYTLPELNEWSEGRLKIKNQL